MSVVWKCEWIGVRNCHETYTYTYIYISCILNTSSPMFVSDFAGHRDHNMVRLMVGVSSERSSQEPSLGALPELFLEGHGPFNWTVQTRTSKPGKRNKENAFLCGTILASS